MWKRFSPFTSCLIVLCVCACSIYAEQELPQAPRKAYACIFTKSIPECLQILKYDDYLELFKDIESEEIEFSSKEEVEKVRDFIIFVLRAGMKNEEERKSAENDILELLNECDVPDDEMEDA